MNTKTLYFPNQLRAKLKLEVIGDGTIVRALSLDSVTGQWIPASQDLYDRPEILEEIKVDLALGRWECEDPVEALKESLRPA